LGVDQVDPGSKPAWASLATGPIAGKGWLPTPGAMPVAANLDDEAVAAFCAEFPDRLIGFASLHPERYRPDLKVERAVKELGLKGVKIYPHAGYNITIRFAWIRWLPIFPDLKIVMCHGGFPWADEFIVVAYSNPNISVDITFLDYVERTFRRDGLVESTVRQLAELIGPERILWGSEGSAMFLSMFGEHGVEYYRKSQDYLVN